MNLPNKITMSRIILSFVVMGILLFPFEASGITLPKLFISESLVVDIKYFIAGALFIIASLTDFIDGYMARKRNLVTDLGKMLDAIADKVLVNSVLIIMASQGFIHAVIPVVIVTRDIIVDTIKMIAGSKGSVVAASNLGKLKTIFMLVGISLTFFYNLPFELWNLRISDFLLIIATILSIVSGVQYYYANKKFISGKNSTDIEILED